MTDRLDALEQFDQLAATYGWHDLEHPNGNTNQWSSWHETRRLIAAAARLAPDKAGEGLRRVVSEVVSGYDVRGTLDSHSVPAGDDLIDALVAALAPTTAPAPEPSGERDDYPPCDVKAGRHTGTCQLCQGSPATEPSRERDGLREAVLAIPGSCDWGGCDNHALLARFDSDKGWLPVCQWHAADASAGDLAPITAIALADLYAALDTGEPARRAEP